VNPALERLLSAFRDELEFAQVLVRRVDRAFELRHIRDQQVPVERLRTIAIEGLRDLAQKTASGAFRPLKSAPNLQRGWRTVTRTPEELELTLGHLYPGALADWLAVEQGPAPVTHYRPFTERQTGMYRITTKLDDSEVAQVIRACCGARFCLKRRLWTIEQTEVDAPLAKSIIPCLEPCALLLELARTAVRINQGAEPQPTKDEIPKLLAAVENADPTVAEADFANLSNPRRAQLALEKLKPRAPEIKH